MKAGACCSLAGCYSAALQVNEQCSAEHLQQEVSCVTQLVLHTSHHARAAPARRLDHQLQGAPCQDRPAVQKMFATQ